MSGGIPMPRRGAPDELTRTLRQARRLWEQFLAACNERDRRVRRGDLEAAEACAVTIAQLDAALLEIEAEIRRLDEEAAA